MKITETKLRHVIREELSKLTEQSGDYAIYEVSKPELEQVKQGADPSRFGTEMKDGSISVLENWAHRQRSWTFMPDRNIPYGEGYFVEQGRVEDNYYVIGQNKR